MMLMEILFNLLTFADDSVINRERALTTEINLYLKLPLYTFGAECFVC